jgi:hypothetical protein
MIGVCSICGIAYETIEEEACNPDGYACPECYKATGCRSGSEARAKGPISQIVFFVRDGPNQIKMVREALPKIRKALESVGLDVESVELSWVTGDSNGT